MMKQSMSYALKLLGIKDYLEIEIFEKVTKKFSLDDANYVIEKLKEFNYLDDSKVIRNYIGYKLRSGYGSYYIINKLYERRVKDVTINFINTIAEEEEIDINKKIVDHKLKFIEKIDKTDNHDNHDNPDNDDETSEHYQIREKIYIKTINFLKYRGYDISLIMKLVKKEEFWR